jgi:hypothetical protein
VHLTVKDLSIVDAAPLAERLVSVSEDGRLAVLACADRLVVFDLDRCAVVCDVDHTVNDRTYSRGSIVWNGPQRIWTLGNDQTLSVVEMNEGKQAKVRTWDTKVLQTNFTPYAIPK